MGPFPSSLERFPRLRQSTLANFDRCALSALFDLEYRRNWSGHPQARGQIFHRVAAEALRQMYKQRESTISGDAVLEILYDTIRQADIDERCGKCGAPARVVPDTQMIECDNGHRHGSNFVNLPMAALKDLRWVCLKFAKDNAFDIANLVDIEQRMLAYLTYPDGEGGKVERELSGQLDALFVLGAAADHAVVLDWKDTWALPAPTEIGFDGYFQQRFYAWLVMKNYKTVERVTLREHYVRYSEFREADVWRADLPDVEDELSALVERFDRAFHERNFPPSPGKHCHLCTRPEACPIFPGVRVEGRIRSQEQAEQYAREALVAQAALEQRQKELRAWASVHGSIPISDHKGPRALGFVERRRVSRPTREAMEAALEGAGVKGVRALLDSLYIESRQTRFEEHQPPRERSDGDDDLIAALMASVERQEEKRGESGEGESGGADNDGEPE